MARTLSTLLNLIARQFSRSVDGTVVSSTATSITDAATLYQPAGWWVNHYIYFPETGLERLITDYTAPTANFAALDEAPTGAYRISQVQQADLLPAFNEALNAAGTAWMVLREAVLTPDESGAYSLPLDCIAVYSSTDLDGMKRDDYTIEGETQYLRLVLSDRRNADESIGAPTLKIMYVGLPMFAGLELGNDESLPLDDVHANECELFIVNYALHLLHEWAVNRNITGESARGHLTQAQRFLDKAQQIKATATRLPARKRARSRSLPYIIQ